MTMFALLDRLTRDHANVVAKCTGDTAHLDAVRVETATKLEYFATIVSGSFAK
jgi:hypothetical protein